MSTLQPFADFIKLNMANLATAYAHLLAESQTGYEHFSSHSRTAAARRLLKGVIAACETRRIDPAARLFEEPPPDSPRRWPPSITPPDPLTEIETLAQTLIPMAPDLETSRFLEQLFSAARAAIFANFEGSPSLPPTPINEQQINGQNEIALPPQETLYPLLKSPAADPSLLEPGPYDLEQSARPDTPFDPLSLPPRPPAASLEQMHLTATTCLADLPLYTFQVDSTALVREVEKVLRAQPILPGLIITANRIAVGVISRRKFYEKLGQLYGVAVYLRRPIGLMLKGMDVEPLRLPAATLIPRALRLALGRPSGFVYEPIVVEQENYTYRLLDVYTLLRAQSKLFANLQAKLQQANNDLEARVEQRTAALVKANVDLTAEVAKRKQIEEALIEARDEALMASRLKSELLAKVSHELRTPLGAILGFTEMIQVGVYGPLSIEQEQVTAKIINSTHYLTSLVNQLLDQAQFEAGKLQLNITPFSPATIVENTVSKLGMTAQNKGLTLTSEIAPDVPAELAGDPVRVQQILVNLVSNAIKFTPAGRVHIRLYCPTPDRWAIEVTDTGPGIPAEAQARIFEPFGQVDGSMTRQSDGTGLGLSIVQQLTGLMGGHINLKSEIGRGSTFTIRLPLRLIHEEILP